MMIEVPEMIRHLMRLWIWGVEQAEDAGGHISGEQGEGESVEMRPGSTKHKNVLGSHAVLSVRSVLSEHPPSWAALTHQNLVYK